MILKTMTLVISITKSRNNLGMVLFCRFCFASSHFVSVGNGLKLCLMNSLEVGRFAGAGRAGYEHRPETGSAWVFVQALSSFSPCDLGPVIHPSEPRFLFSKIAVLTS